MCGSVCVRLCQCYDLDRPAQAVEVKTVHEESLADAEGCQLYNDIQDGPVH